MGSALQKPWMKDLTQQVIDFAKRRAAEAVKRLHGSQEDRLRAYKDVADVHAKLAGHGDGTFSGWAEEELKVSKQTASNWATIGTRYDELYNALYNLPDSWGSWYELAKADDKVFKIVLRRVKQDMTRGEIMALVNDIERELAPPIRATTSPSKRARAETTQPSRALPPATASAIPKNAAKQATVEWKSALAGLIDLVDDSLYNQSHLSPEAKHFIFNNYIKPMQKLLKGMEPWQNAK